jgi:hypothetical protein
VTAVCVAVVCAQLLTFVTLQYLLVERRTGIPVLETVRDDAIVAIVAGVPLLAVTMLGLRVLLDSGLPPVAAMALPGLAGLAVYGAILRAAFRSTWNDIGMLAGRLGGSSLRRRIPDRLRLFRRTA